MLIKINFITYEIKENDKENGALNKYKFHTGFSWIYEELSNVKFDDNKKFKCIIFLLTHKNRKSAFPNKHLWIKFNVLRPLMYLWIKF